MTSAKAQNRPFVTPERKKILEFMIINLNLFQTLYIVISIHYTLYRDDELAVVRATPRQTEKLKK